MMRNQKNPTYCSWIKMRTRCNNPKNEDYKYYGARGIKVCERWDDFANFLADMGERPSRGHTIDRINPDLGYEPRNCRWATVTEQNRNKRRDRKFLVDGMEMLMHELAAILGVDRSYIGQVVRKVERA